MQENSNISIFIHSISLVIITDEYLIEYTKRTDESWPKIIINIFVIVDLLLLFEFDRVITLLDLRMKSKANDFTNEQQI